MNIVLIDNYDSFTYILVQYFREHDGVRLEVIRNDKIDSTQIAQYDKIVISPGPGLPSQNGRIVETIQLFSGNKPILGVCLGLQAIYEAFGGRLLNLPQVHHGVSSSVVIVDQDDPVLAGISNPFFAGRYHSWVCDPEFIPADLIVSAVDNENQIMACHHHHHQTYGVQFHPESILTPEGKKMIRNFVHLK